MRTGGSVLLLNKYFPHGVRFSEKYPQIEARFLAKGLVSTWADLYNVYKHFTKYKGASHSEMINQFMGYTVHRPQKFQSSTALFTKENETITVSMLQEALDHMISAIAKENPIFERYSVTLKVLRAIQVRLANGQPRKPSKQELKTACEVLSEIQKEYVATEAQRVRIDLAAAQCKLFIECFMRD